MTASKPGMVPGRKHSRVKYGNKFKKNKEK